MGTTDDINWKRISAEGVAIVVSILLAFGIEAWWQDRNEAILEQRLLTALLVEFEQNGALLRQSREVYEQYYTDAIRVLDLIAEDPATIDAAELEGLFGSLLASQTFHLESGTLNGLLASGEMSLIRDETLRNRLAAWPSYAGEWSEEEEAVFNLVGESLIPYLSERMLLRSINRTFPPFSDGQAPRSAPPGSNETASMASVVASTEFDNLVYRKANGTWHAMRDGETLRAQLSEIIELIRRNLDE
jgi:hypothetical protein